MACHAFSVAGTVYPDVAAGASAGLQGATVEVVDARGTKVSLTTNAAGNFYTSQALALPLASAAVSFNGKRLAMAGQPAGPCSSCHALPPGGGAAGRLFAN